MQVNGGTLSVGSLSSFSPVALNSGKLEITSSDVDVTDGEVFGDTVSLSSNQHLIIHQTAKVADDGRVELSGGRLLPVTATTSGCFH